MEKIQKEHIIKNLDKLVMCTKNEDIWYNLLLEKNLFTANTLDEIRNSQNETHSEIEKLYLECLKLPKFDLLRQTLKNSQNDDAVNILEEVLASSLSTLSEIRKKLIWFGMQPVTKHYQGRDDELQKIHDCWLKSRSDDTLTFVGLTGLGGIGKSELARKYAYKFYTEVQGHCIWISSANHDTFTESFHRLGKRMGIALQDSLGNEKNLESLTIDVYKSLSKENYLLVFDNLESYEEKFLKYFVDYATKIPSKQTKPFVILTSRYQLINKEFEPMTKQLMLSALPSTSAVSYFKHALNIPEKKVISDLQSLCQELDCLPLAMQQAAAYINEMKQNSDVATEIKDYLKIFKRKSKNLLEYPVPKYQNRDSFSKPTYLTWQITLDKFKLNPEFHSLVTLTLNTISFFQSENISVNLLKSIIGLAFFESTDKKLAFYEGGPDVFETLCNYSMCQINRIENEIYISVHRLVQVVSQIKLKEEQKWAETLNMLMEIVNMFQDAITPKDIVHIASLLRHTDENTSVIVKLEVFYNILEEVQRKYTAAGLFLQGKMFSKFAIRQIMLVYGDEASQTLRIMTNYGNILRRCGELVMADQLLNRVYQQHFKHCNESSLSSMLENPDVLYTKQCIAATCEEMGKYDVAQKMYLELLDVFERLFGIGHPATLSIKSSIAGTHKIKGNYDEALKLYFEALIIQERVLGIDDSCTLITKSNMATVLENKGKYDDALKIYLEVLEVRKRLHDTDHPDTLGTIINIAFIHQRKANYDKALEFYLEVLEIQKRVIGIEHPDTLTTMKNIALTHSSKGNYDDALQMFLKVLEIEEQVLGIDHPSALTTKQMIVVTYKEKGIYDEALKISMEVLKVQNRVLGMDHPNTLTTKQDIASTHQHKGNYDEALKILLEVKEVSERILGIEHPSTLSIMNNIAGVHEDKGNYDEALKICHVVHEVRQRILGIDHPHTLTTKNNIALTHLKKGNYDDALKMFLEVVEVSERVLGIEHPVTLTAMDNIATTHRNKTNYDQAFTVFFEVLQVREHVLGIAHPDSITTRNNIASTYHSIGNYDEALKMFVEVLEVGERVLGTDHPYTLTIKRNVAGTHESKGNNEGALKMYMEILDVSDRVLGVDHYITLATKNNISAISGKKMMTRR